MHTSCTRELYGISCWCIFNCVVHVGVFFTKINSQISIYILLKKVLDFSSQIINLSILNFSLNGEENFQRTG